MPAITAAKPSNRSAYTIKISGFTTFKAFDIDKIPEPMACVVSNNVSPTKSILTCLQILNPSSFISFNVFPKLLSKCAPDTKSL